ncbi:lysylphosphatidylglycerol synthase transmembrane domain-containing protein [Paraburkholderia haematera]|uniref:lysylphosphatidylglycerol synthase transmembrane domain-containing protein n=1 Tax=Paraburkholderia haematera TaxID=2793077 RepID=UPI001B8C0527|nr:lysylphosphatidylglycerol synthase transmembrane domain-containing protein [Paraburkholderia haematera]
MIRSHTRKAAVLVALAGIGLAAGAPFVLNSHTAFAGLRHVSLYVFAALAVSAAISAMAKTGKLHLMQAALGFEVSFLRTFAITLATDFAFLASPLGAAGYGVNIGLLQRAGASWSLATTVVGADQALDLAFFATAVPVSLLFAFGPLTQLLPHASAPLVFAVLAGGGCLAGVFWLTRQRVAAALDATGRRVRWLNERRARLSRFCRSVGRQWRELIGGRKWRLAALLLLTTLQWLLRYGALWYILLELGYRLPLGFVLAVQAVALHAALWTGVPAGGGTGDIALAAAFASWVPRASIATALVLWRFATLYCPLMLGAAGFVALAMRGRSALPAAE